MQTAWPNSLASLRHAALSAGVRPLLRGLSRATGLAVSVIMPTCGKATYLDLTLAALECQVFPADMWELIVIDDASADATPQVLKFYAERGRLPLVSRRSPKNRGRAGRATTRWPWRGATSSSSSTTTASPARTFCCSTPSATGATWASFTGTRTGASRRTKARR